jgi:hypothetical protein
MAESCKRQRSSSWGRKSERARFSSEANFARQSKNFVEVVVC